MKIKITDAKKLIAALEAVNQKASSHTPGIAEIMGLELDNKIALLPKKDWKGSRRTEDKRRWKYRRRKDNRGWWR